MKKQKGFIRLDELKKRIRVDCDCGGEIVQITPYEDMYILTIYKSSFAKGFWFRLRQAWRYFRKGEFEGNEIVIWKDEFEKFVNELQKHKPAIDKDKLNDEFRMIISHAYLGYDNDMELNEFNNMLDNLVKAVTDLRVL